MEPSVSIIIITTGRPSLYPLLRALEGQEADFTYEVVLIANGPVDEALLPGGGVRIIREEPGLGIPYYRNAGTAAARGGVIVYIDDDEMPADGRWLQALAGPVVGGLEKVTVAGAVIKEGQGLLADLISLLGYPGGGSLGWRNVWEVDADGYTDKLCTCNCAIDKRALEKAGGFHEGLALGASDLFLGEVFLEKGVRIKFLDEAAVFHEARRDFRGFVSWQVSRGRSVYDLKQIRPLGQFQRKHVGGRMKRTLVILEKTFPTRRFVPMLGILFLEFACHLIGYILQSVEHKRSDARASAR